MADVNQAYLRHADYYRGILAAADSLYQQGGVMAGQGLEMLDREWENIRAGQARAQAFVKHSCRAAEVCNQYPMHGANLLDLRFNPHEQVNWIEAGLAAARQLGDTRAEAIHLSNVGLAFIELGNLCRGVECQE